MIALNKYVLARLIFEMQKQSLPIMYQTNGTPVGIIIFDDEIISNTAGVDLKLYEPAEPKVLKAERQEIYKKPQSKYCKKDWSK